MLHMSQLLTASGFIQAIKDHHKHLNKSYNFPPLSGLKPVHKFAELFGFASAEPFTAKLEAMHARMLKTTVNLARLGSSEIVHVEVERGEEDWENQIRCFLPDDHAFVITTIEPEKLGPAIVQYHDGCTVTVFLGIYAVQLYMSFNSIDASIYEADTAASLDFYTSPADNPAYKLIDQSGTITAWTIAPSTSKDEQCSNTNESGEKEIDSNCDAAPVDEERLNIEIMATVKSDDWHVNITFNTLDYFENALKNGNVDEVFEALDGCDFSNDYPVDNVVEYFSDTATRRLFNHLELFDRDSNIGYQCIIDKDAALKWLARARTAV